MRSLLIIFFLAYAGSLWSQNHPEKKLTIELTNITLAEALTILGISYGVDISYSDNIVPVDKIVNLSLRDEGLTGALDKLLAPFKVSYKISKNRVLLKRAMVILTQTIRGSVLEEVTNVPVAGATIIVKNNSTQLGTATDSIGRYRINDVPVGRVSVAISCIGYNSRTIENILLGTGKELVLEVKVSPSITAMDEVVVVADKRETIPGDGVAFTSSRSFTVEESKRYAGSLGDPARMASAFAGVTAASDESNALIVRGNSPRGMLWRIEGIEVPNPSHFTNEGASGGVVSVLSSNVIESSDFLTGAFPAQYGNALSGVFDIRLRNGNNEKQEYSFQAGVLGLELSAEGPFSKRAPSSYLVNYRYSTLSILDELNFDLNEAGQYKDYQDLFFKIDLPASNAGTFSLFGAGGKSHARKKNEAIYDDSRSDVGILGITYRNNLGGRGYMQGSVSWSGTQILRDNEISDGAGWVQVEESYNKSYIRASVSAKTRMSSSYTLEGGVTHSILNFDFYMRNRDDANLAYPTIINFSERGMTNITQGYLQARQFISRSWFAYYGFHFLNFALTNDPSWEPRVGVRWQPSEKTSWSIAYGKHSRIENLQYYLGRDHQSDAIEVQINKQLGFTRADHIVISYERTYLSGHRIKVEPYYQRLYNAPVQLDPSTFYSSINEDTGFITDTLVNRGTGLNYGIEFSVEKKFSNNFYYLANMSLFESQFSVHDLPQRNTVYNGSYSLHALGGKEIDVHRGRDRVGANLKLTFAGGRPYVPIDLQRSIDQQRTAFSWTAAYEKTLPDYFRADIQVVYRVNRPRYSIEWRLDIQNVTDHENAAYYFFNKADDTIQLKRQVGFLPLMSCRIDF